MEVALKLTENASLRGMRNEDGVWYFSVYDFVNFVTGHELGETYAVCVSPVQLLSFAV